MQEEVWTLVKKSGTCSDHLAGACLDEVEGSRILEDQVLDPNPANVCTRGKIETPAFPLRSSGTRPEVLVEGGKTRSSNPSLKQSARRSMTADAPKLQPAVAH